MPTYNQKQNFLKLKLNDLKIIKNYQKIVNIKIEELKILYKIGTDILHYNEKRNSIEICFDCKSSTNNHKTHLSRLK